MYLRNFISTFILPLTVSAARHRHQHRSFGPPTTTTVTVTDTVTENIAPSLSTVTSGNSTSTAPSNVPTGPYTAVAIRSGSPFHLLAITAAGLNFTLGGAPATYCPSTIEQCPSGNSTAFLGYGAMYVETPGGQLVYISNDGRLGYTQAHSASYPPGAILAPFTYSKAENASYGYLSTEAFDAPGFMACPTARGSYQVFAAVSNATVPSGNISDCVGFVARTADYQGPEVWQYI